MKNTKLFDSRIPVLKYDEHTNDKLDELKKKFPQYDEYYVVSAALSDRRKLFEQLWKKYQKYADPHFLPEVRLHFHQRTWEMYVTVMLVEHGYNVSSNAVGPDICINGNGKGNSRIWIECIAVDKGEGPDGVPAMPYGIASHVPQEQITLRVCGAFKAKSDKFKEYVTSGIVAPTDISIIAINRGFIAWPESEPPYFTKVLYGLGHHAIRIPQDGIGETESFVKKNTEIVKSTGSGVSTTYFLDKDHSHISAVMYSKDTVLNVPDEYGTEIVVAHNPHATQPLKMKEFPFMTQYWAENNHVHWSVPERKSIVTGKGG